MSRVYPGQYATATRTQDPRHSLGAVAEDHFGRRTVYGRAITGLTVGELAAPNLYATITSGIEGKSSTNTFASSASSFVVRVTDVSGKVTTWERPAIGSILHVAGGAGKQQFARVTNVLTTTKLGVEVIGSSTGWTTELGATDTVRIIEPLFAPYDISSHTLPPVGYTLAPTVAVGDFAWFGNKGVFKCVPNTLVEGTRMMVGTTAGQIEPAEMYGTVAWDPGEILDGNEEAKELTVAGAALGDFVHVSAILDTIDLALTAQVTAANTVTMLLLNNTGGTIATGDLGDLVPKVRVDARTTLPNYMVGDLISAP